jgi:1-acyl-sn-glycerol-3-phosphate acyltransferase
MGNEEIDRWDRGSLESLNRWLAPVVQRYFRAEVRHIDRIPERGAALIVSNHSGGMLTPDVFVFAPRFYRRFGFDRHLYTLAHYGVVLGPAGLVMNRLGVIAANPDNAADALHAGHVVLVFPGGDYDSYRPTLEANVIDFDGRTGYVRTAMEAGVPIVPVVSIGAQETQFFVTRGKTLATMVGLTRLRTKILPVSIGWPFGVSVFVPPNVPLPAKVVTEVLEPVDIAARFGEDADPEEVDAHIRGVMQEALDRLAAARRFPILG